MSREVKGTRGSLKIVLMGDSILDNSVWLKDPTKDLKHQLQDAMGKDFEIVNLAVDQMSTHDLEKRESHVNPWSQYEYARKKVFGNEEGKYPVAKDGNIYSLQNLANLTNVHMVIVSIGGNDLYLDPNMQLTLVKSLIPFKSGLRDVEVEKFSKRYKDLMHKISNIVPYAIIMPVIPYHPHYDFPLFQLPYKASKFKKWALLKSQYLFLSKLVTPMVKEILSINLALGSNGMHTMHIMDLSKTFDPKNQTHYGSESKSFPSGWSGAEPSIITIQYMVQMIARILDKDVSSYSQTNTIWRDRVTNELVEKPITIEYIESYKFA